MRAKHTIFALVTTALIASLGDRAAAQDDNTPEAKARAAMVGKQAPAINVSHWINSNGRTLSLSSLRGKVVVLDFFAFW